jgi:hypothetical protein
MSELTQAKCKECSVTTDYLNLLRIKGRWWIVNKIYTVERRSGP